MNAAARTPPRSADMVNPGMSRAKYLPRPSMTQWYGHKQAALAASNWRPLALPVSNDRRVLSARADVQMMQQIIAVASPLGIAMHDHIVVGKEGHTGLKGLKLI